MTPEREAEIRSRFERAKNYRIETTTPPTPEQHASETRAIRGLAAEGLEAFSALDEARAERDRIARQEEKLADVLASVQAERDRYRIESDCGMRDFDALELRAGIMRFALERIANPRANMPFDPWARDMARDALASERDTAGTPDATPGES
jgi:hypothetical protein